jgi:hypothetical protein
MGSIFVGVLALFAVLSWAVAFMASIALVRMSSKGTRFRNYGRLGWWRFAELEADLGPGSLPHLSAYKRASIAFLICASAGLIIGGYLTTGARI